MTYEERVLQGRRGYSKYVAKELLKLYEFNGITDISKRVFGTVCKISFNQDSTVTLQFRRGYCESFRELTFSVFSKMNGENSLESWLCEHNPCVAAGFLKNARKKLRDNKSLEGGSGIETNDR